MIHYNGPLSPRPHRRACGAVSAQAEAKTWHATDCRGCKASMEGLLVTDESGRLRGQILSVSGHHARVAWSDGATHSARRIPLSDLDRLRPR